MDHVPVLPHKTLTISRIITRDETKYRKLDRRMDESSKHYPKEHAESNIDSSFHSFDVKSEASLVLFNAEMLDSSQNLDRRHKYDRVGLVRRNIIERVERP